MARSQSQKLSSSARSEVGGGSQSIKLKDDDQYEYNEALKDPKIKELLTNEKFQKDFVEHLDPAYVAQEEADDSEFDDSYSKIFWEPNNVPLIKVADKFIEIIPKDTEFETTSYKDYYNYGGEKIDRMGTGYKVVDNFEPNDFFNKDAYVTVYNANDKFYENYKPVLDGDGKVKTIGGYEVWTPPPKSKNK
jgi:hypothetical protein